MLTNENPESEEGGLLFSRFRSHLYSSSVSSLCLFKTQPSKSILYPKEGQPLLDVCSRCATMLLYLLFNLACPCLI